MAVINKIKLTNLEGAKRIDAEYYQPKYFSLLDKLRNRGGVPIKEIAIPAKRKFYPEEYKFFDYIEIAAVDLSTGEFNASRILGKEAPDRAQWIVKKGDILVSTVRPIRNAVVLITEDKKNLVCSSGFCVLQPKNISPSYIFLYFKVNSIVHLLDRYTTATEYPAVSWSDVLNIPIFLGNEEFRRNISNFLQRIFSLLQESKSFYFLAENLLLEELGLRDFKPQYKKTYAVNLSHALNVHRIDAEYFQPAYEEVIEKLKANKIELKPLGKFILDVQKGIEPGSENYKDEGKPFIRVGNLSVNGYINRDQKYLSDELYMRLRETYEPKQGDFLLTKDATPGIAYVVKEHMKGIISSGILKLQINEREINKEYLALCINSPVCKMQIERDGGGSVIIHWKPEEVKRLRIPLLPLESQQKIASLVQQSHQARKKAKELLESAKRAVEIAIEKNEKEALNYLFQWVE